MAQKIESLFLETTAKQDTPNKDISKNEKSSPSFFDSLLSKTNENKEEIKTSDNKPKEIKEEQKVDNKEVKVENKESPIKGGNLLDKLIVEAKKELVNKEEKVEGQLPTNKKEVITDGNVKIDSKNNKSEIKDVVKELVENSSENENKEEIKTSDNKPKEIKEEQKVDNKEVKGENKENLVKTNNSLDNSSIDIDKSQSKELKNIDGIDVKLNTNINISKEELADKNIDKSQSKSQPQKSLMDQLLQKDKQFVFGNESLDIDQKETKSKEFLTNIYLGSQKNSISNQFLVNKKEAFDLVSNGTNVGDVQTAASMMDLGLEDIDVQRAVENIRKLDLDKLDRSNLLDKLAFSKNIMHIDLKDMITKSVEASKALTEDTINIVDDLTLNANTQTVQTIQSRIIGAKQQMSQMMSDVARQMYENYKPPVTAFRVNINPATLGTISILMKSDKDSALSISMSVSNNATLDALVDNQSNLRNSLNKLFDENTKFNLDFSSSEQNSGSSNQNEQNQQKQEEGGTLLSNTQNEENKDIKEEKETDYM